MANVKIKPLGDRVIVKPIERETMEGEVLAVGAGKLNDKGERAPMDVKKGDRVLYGKYSGTEVKLDDETYLIIHQDEILGILG